MEGKEKIEQLISNVKEYAEVRADLFALKIQDKTSDILSSIAAIAIVSLLGVIIILFISIGSAWLIGQSMENPSMGFFIVGGFYFLLAVIIFYNRENWIKLPIVNAIIKKININEQD